MPRYAELQVTTNYSFLRGASDPDELFEAAAKLGLAALGITDRNTLRAMVRAHQAAAASGVRLVVGCHLDLALSDRAIQTSDDRAPSNAFDGNPDPAPSHRAQDSVLVYPTDRAAYARLCRLLTLGKSRAGKGACRLSWNDLAGNGEGLLVVLLESDRAIQTSDDRAPSNPFDGNPDSASGHRALGPRLARLAAAFPGRGYLALTPRRRPNDGERLAALAEAARRAKIPILATNDVLYHIPERRILQDVLTCIREKCTIDQAGFRRERFADRHLLAPAEMIRRLARHPEAIAATEEIVARCDFSLAELRYQYPREASDLSPQQMLERRVWEAAPLRYPEGVPSSVSALLRHELSLIGLLSYAPYFLTVHNIVRHARAEGILCQGRGSAANSAVCYVLGITSIDPVRAELLFERFISAERNEPPDIDVDFEHERREEVIQWIFATYGRDRAALTATVIRYRPKSALRDVGKALGLDADRIAQLSGGIWGREEADLAAFSAPAGPRRLRLTLRLARELLGFPRHLSQHPGGFVLTEDRLDELVPIEPAATLERQVIEWDKDDIDALNFMKVDVLGLGMLGCLRRCFDLLRQHRHVCHDIASIPPEDPATYAMIRKADTLGVFQIESRAQMAMLPRLRPTTFYDLVIEVAIVRPGPIQGDMVHPYLQRRQGRELVSFPTPELESVLGRTLGVPLFQEQAMRIAIVAAGFTPAEADALRRSMATFRFTGQVSHFRDKLVRGMVRNGYTAEFAERTFRQIEGFGSYGFPESHAASFALIAYASSWMKCHHPEIFCAALLNSQPMGFYAPAQIVRDARAHGIEVRPVSVNASRFDCTLEAGGEDALAVRLGFRMVKGLSAAHAARLVAACGENPYASVAECASRSGVAASTLALLASADGFADLGLDRRHALWAVRGLAEPPLPLFAASGGARFSEPEVALARRAEGAEVIADYRAIGLSLRRHPLFFLRTELARRGILPCAALAASRDGRRVTVAGLALLRQRPGSAGGVTFMTIEDETAFSNLVIWPDLFERERRLVLAASLIACSGRMQREQDVIHVIAERLTDLSSLLGRIGEGDDERGIKIATRDFR
ncbi:MAG: error-prone DNA polymerase [Acetobacteraceae bacterium]